MTLTVYYKVRFTGTGVFIRYCVYVMNALTRRVFLTDITD